MAINRNSIDSLLNVFIFKLSWSTKSRLQVFYESPFRFLIRWIIESGILDGGKAPTSVINI